MPDSRDDVIFETGAELFAEIKRRGLHLTPKKKKGRDRGLAADLRSRLRCPDGNLERHLKRQQTSAQEFLREFLSIARPFSLMYTDIYEFLARSAATRGTEQIRVRVAPGELVELEQFRDWALSAERCIRLVLEEHWPEAAMHALFEIPRICLGGWKDTLREWPRYSPYENTSFELLDLPDPNGSSDFDRMLSRVHRMFQSTADAYRESAAESEGQPRLANITGAAGERDEDDELKGRAFLLTDLLPAWSSVFDRQSQIPVDSQADALAHFRSQVEPLIQSREVERETQALDPLDVLSLPFWRHRWRTYEIWATVRTLGALEPLRPAVRVEDQEVVLARNETGIAAALESRSYPSASVIVELETKTKGGGRESIRPDTSVCFDDSLTAESRAFLVENKQVQELDAEYVEHLAEDYLAGSSSAHGLLILNYDKAPAVPDLREDATLLGNMRPGSETLADFERRVIELAVASGLHVPGGVVVMLDVSGSMKGQYSKPQAQAAINILRVSRWLTVQHFNDRLIEPDPHGGVDTRGGTDLPNSLDELVAKFGVPRALLVVSDGGHGGHGEQWNRIPHARECTAEELRDGLQWLAETTSRHP